MGNCDSKTFRREFSGEQQGVATDERRSNLHTRRRRQRRHWDGINSFSSPASGGGWRLFIPTRRHTLLLSELIRTCIGAMFCYRRVSYSASMSAARHDGPVLYLRATSVRPLICAPAGSQNKVFDGALRIFVSASPPAT